VGFSQNAPREALKEQEALTRAATALSPERRQRTSPSAITPTSPLRKHTRSRGPSLRRSYPASTVQWPCPTPAGAAALMATSRSLPRPRRVSPNYPHYPPSVPCPLPRRTKRVACVDCYSAFAVIRASAPSLSRPARTSLALRPAGLLNRPRRPLSRDFDPLSYPNEPLVSYQINRQLTGLNPPPLVIQDGLPLQQMYEHHHNDYMAPLPKACQPGPKCQGLYIYRKKGRARFWGT
jgi:hypothetical protein